MRNASKVLGIIGGALSLVIALLCIISGILVLTLGSGFMRDVMDLYVRYTNIDFISSIMVDWAGHFLGIVMIVVGFFSAVCGVLGLIGGLMVPKNNTTAGVLLIVAAGVSLLFSGGGLVTTVLFTLAGIFALVREKAPQVPASPEV